MWKRGNIRRNINYKKNSNCKYKHKSRVSERKGGNIQRNINYKSRTNKNGNYNYKSKTSKRKVTSAKISTNLTTNQEKVKEKVTFKESKRKETTSATDQQKTFIAT